MSIQSKSKIIGQALIKFGGSIVIETGYNLNTGAVGLRFSETKKEHSPGEELSKDEETYGGQVTMWFDNLISLEVLRNCLDICEYALKYGEFPKIEEI